MSADAEAARPHGQDGDAAVAALRSHLNGVCLSGDSRRPPAEACAGAGREVGSAATAYRWQLVELQAENGLQPPPLAFAADTLAKEASDKRWKPQGPVRKLMESYHVYLVKKAPAHYKTAKYVCRVCELHFETLLGVQKHVTDQRHVGNTRRQQEMTAVSTLPEPTAAQTARLTALLTELYQRRGLTPPRLQQRRQVAELLRSTVLEGLRQRFDGDECSLDMFGSARHGCGFADSCLDMALLTTDDSPGAAQLTHVIQVLQDSPLFTEVTSDFHSWVPSVRCVHAASGQSCLVGLGAGRDVQLARLVQLYTTLDPRTAPLALALRHLAQICEMDRPHAGSLPPSAFVLMAIYYLQRCEPPVLPVLHELAGDPRAEPPADLDLAAAGAAAASWRTSNTDNLGALWLQMLRFYALELAETDTVVCIRQREPVSRADKGWGNKKISVEDPIQSKRNISRSISSGVVADVIVDRLRAACLLFGVPRTAAGAAIRLQADRTPPEAGDAARLAEQLGRITEQQMVYDFDKELLCGETSMPLVCSACQKQGHMTDDCPTLVVPPPEPLPPPGDQQMELLGRICTSVFHDWAPPEEEHVIRQNMLRGIESYIRHRAFPSARLTLFGSSVNGFGFRNSDLDICMTFEDCEEPQTLDQPEIIKELAETLSRFRPLCNVIPISTAKVPIVKFTDRCSRLEGDISLYNTLAQHNTMLLHTYSKLDYRAQVLGYMVKLMAKICDICDASRGSLSSYAYTLMLIYYLQRCEPPVLPVLQELDAAARAPKIVDGSDVSFFTDLERLRRHWPSLGANQSSIGQLWTGFLRFYGEQFDFDLHVVCIRRRDVLTKFEKLWNGAFIAIEDPFLLSHNLGGGVRRKMASFIRRTFLCWRRHHIRPTPRTLPRGYRDVKAFLMSANELCEGRPPNSSGCHACGRIGHWANDCPNRRGRQAAGKDEPRRQPKERHVAEQPARQAPPQRAAAEHAATQPPASRTTAEGSQRRPAPSAADDSAQLLALLGSCAAGLQERRPRVPGMHRAESLERQQTAPAPAPGQTGARPPGPPPGFSAPGLTQALLAQLRQSAPWPHPLSQPQLQPQAHALLQPQGYPQTFPPMQPPGFLPPSFSQQQAQLLLQRAHQQQLQQQQLAFQLRPLLQVSQPQPGPLSVDPAAPPPPPPPADPDSPWGAPGR